MPNIEITKTTIDRLAPSAPGKQTLFWDTRLTGFGVLVGARGKSYVVQHNLPGGRARRLTVGPSNIFTVDEARARARELLADLYKGIDPKAARLRAEREKVTLRATLNAYLAARGPGTTRALRISTCSDYRSFVERHLPDWLDKSLREITTDMVEKRHRAIQADIQRRKDASAKAAGRPSAHPAHWGQSLAGANTANIVMIVLGLLWNHAALDDDSLPPNPTTILKRKKAWFAAPRRKRRITDDQMAAFYEAVCGLENPVARDYIQLLLFTGLRRNEAAALRWDEVDFRAGLIQLPANRVKNKQDFDLPMSSFVRDLLVARRAVGNDHGWVFPANSRSGHIEEPGRALDLVARQHPDLAFAPHDLRRTFVTVAESTDISYLALKALVNHSVGEKDVTAGYVGMATERLREPAQRVCDRLKELCGIDDPAGDNILAMTNN